LFSRDAGKSVSCCLILQSKAQIERIYGQNISRELFDSARATIILGCGGSIDLANELSERSGREIREQTSKNFSGKDKKDTSEHKSEMVSQKIDRSVFLNMRSLYEIIILLQGRTAYKIDTKFF
jgi:type IV secretory pathway TraG/TraD family ATPase VirD4